MKRINCIKIVNNKIYILNISKNVNGIAIFYTRHLKGICSTRQDFFFRIRISTLSINRLNRNAHIQNII